MNIAQKARVAAIAVIATTLLAGCSAAAPSRIAPSDWEPSATPTAATAPDHVDINIVKVEAPTKIIVTAKVYDDKSDRLYGVNNHLYGKNLTVISNLILAPKKGDCGFDEALAYAKKALAKSGDWHLQYDSTADGGWIDAEGHHGNLRATSVGSYDMSMLRAGFAYGKPGFDEASYTYGLDQKAAQAAGAGLWTTCPGFGA